MAHSNPRAAARRSGIELVSTAVKGIAKLRRCRYFE